MEEMKKAVVSVLGNDQRGIIARVTKILYEHDVNILDISQTVVSGYFNMMMVVDGSSSAKTFDKLCADLSRIGSDKGVEIRCQKSEIFEKMHRV